MKKDLPQTGMGDNTWLLLDGGRLLIGGLIFILRKKQNGNPS